MTINDLLAAARQNKCSDVHITMDRNPIFRINGSLMETDLNLSPQEKEAMIYEMLTPDQKQNFSSIDDLDFAYATTPDCRHRVNVFHQNNKLACVIRVINNTIPTFQQLNLPPVLRELADQPRGLVLITGPTGSGKSTTLAAMLDYINSTRSEHILTIEDPIEYVYSHKRSIIHQREVGIDVTSFAGALRSSLREDPDVILVGEMRDYETISAAITAAETGHLVFSTLHTQGAADTIDRIIDVFPAHNQQQIRTQLAATLRGVVTQTLLPKLDGGGRVAAFEIMTGTDAVLNLIRENKCHQLVSAIQTSAKQGMTTLTASLAHLVRTNQVALEVAMERARNKEEFLTTLQA